MRRLLEDSGHPEPETVSHRVHDRAGNGLRQVSILQRTAAIPGILAQ
jgi:hypothetical protein